MASSRDEYVLNLERLQFFKKYFGPLLWTLFAALVVIAILIGAFVIVKTQKVEREYFAVENGRLTKMVPLGEPFLLQSDLLNWAKKCVTSANTFDFVNYQKQFQENSACFTPEGWEQFMGAVEKSGNLETVKTQRLVASSVEQGAPIITREGLRKGVYSWEVELPILVTYQGGQGGRGTISQRLLVKLLISRVSTAVYKEGVGIVQYIGAEK